VPGEEGGAEGRGGRGPLSETHSCTAFYRLTEDDIIVGETM
jgi:hypothetical protein